MSEVQMEDLVQGQPSELKDIVVRAGAGAGKTTALVTHVLETVQSFRYKHSRWPRVVTTTFTRKATQELRERLLKRAREMDSSDLTHYVLAKTDLQVTTIHGILHTLLSKHGHRIGIDPMLQLVEEEQIIKTAKSILIRIVSKESELSALIRHLSAQRIAELFVKLSREKNLNPGLMVVDKNKYDNDLLRLVHHIESEVQTISKKIAAHSDSKKWKEYSDHLMLAAQVLVESKDFELFLEKLAEVRKPGFKIDKPDLDANVHEEFESLRKNWKSLDTQVFSKDLSTRYLELHSLLEQLFQKFEPLYLQKIKKAGILTIADLEGYSLKLLREAPDAFHAFSESWDYWLIDEYQDTSPTQVELLKKMIGGKPSYTVGDPQQSIYLFRGAQVRVFDERQSLVQSSAGEVRILDKSWRSTPEYVQFMNELFPKFGSGFKKMIPKSDAKESNAKVAKWARSLSPDDEFAFISRELYRLLETGVRPKDIGILARKNSTLERLAQKLEANGFPIQVVSSGGFFFRREILDLVAILKTMINPHDNSSLLEAFRSPWLCTPDGVLSEWSRLREKGESLWQALNRLNVSTTNLTWIRRAIVRSEEVGMITAFEELVIDLGVLDFAADHDASGQRESNIWKFILLLRSTFAKSGVLHSEMLHKMLSTLDLDSSVQESQAIAAFEPDKTVLMTIHASKGLEFRHVILPSLASRPSAVKEYDFLMDQDRWHISFKDYESDETLKSPAWYFEVQKRRQEESQEFERLFYVAVTRAKESLILSDGAELAKGSWSEKLGLAWPYESPACEVVTDIPASPIQWQPDTKKNVVSLKPWRGLEVKTNRPFRQSVTSLLEQATNAGSILDPKNEAVSPKLLEKRISSSLKGTKIHRCLEALHYGGLQSYKDLAAELMGDKSSDASKALNFILSVNEPPLETLIKEGFVEWGFHFLSQGTVVEGQVDLWGYHNNEIWVVDYKTGSSYQAEKAFDQLTIYSYALSLKQKNTKINMSVVYPFEGKVINRVYSGSRAKEILDRLM